MLSMQVNTNRWVFLGIDLGWYGKPSGLAAIVPQDGSLRLQAVARLECMDEILDWIGEQCEGRYAVAGVDAPTVIANATGTRLAEQELNREFRRFHAGCHAANLGLPFAQNVLTFSRRLEALGFAHGAQMQARQPGMFQIEVHPHAASVRLFDLDRIVKYKRGLRAQRAKELRRLRSLMLHHFPLLDPPFTPQLPRVPARGDLKPVEDQLDAVMCAYIAAHFHYWGPERNTVYGGAAQGYVIVPHPHQRNLPQI